MARKAKYLTDADTFNREYERLVALRKQLSDRLAEVNQLIDGLKQNSELPEEVREHLTDLESEASNLAALLTTSKTYASSIEDYYTSWSATKEKIDDELKKAKEQNDVLSKLVSDTEVLQSILNNESERSTTLLDDARKTLEIVTNSSLSSAFKVRSDDRRKARRWWTVAVVIAISLFAGSVLFAVTQVAPLMTGVNELSVWLLRLVVVGPFAYILYFVTRQYSHERDLEEKYAFKSLVSQTLQNNTKLLNDEFVIDDSDEAMRLKVLDFAIGSMKGVYREPYKSTSFESKVKFNPKKTNVEAEARASETA